eukprot:1237757-Prymnesium_polylepis.1
MACRRGSLGPALRLPARRLRSISTSASCCRAKPVCIRSSISWNASTPLRGGLGKGEALPY